MSTDVICKVLPGGLKASNAIESEKLDSLRGREVMAKILIPRNLEFHKKFFALIGTAFGMADTDWNIKQFRYYVTAGAGYCDFITDDEGGVVAVPGSISFASMEQTEFERLYQDVLTFICQRFVLDEDDINEIVRFM